MNSVIYDINYGTIDIYLSEVAERSEYALFDSAGRMLSKGCFFGRVKKTCLYIGELKPGPHTMEVNGIRMDFIVQPAI